MDTHTVIVGHGAQYGIIPGGVYYEKGRVDALLARIREAVEAERSEVEYVFGNWSVPDQKDTLGRWWDAQSALDALLADGECSTLCAPGSGERCMVTDSGICPNCDA